MNTAELQALLALQYKPGISNAVAKKLLTHFKEPYAVLAASKKALQELSWVPQHALNNWKWDKALAAAADQQALMSANQVNAVAYYEPDYPRALKHCTDGPLILFYKGNIPWQQQRWISVVGTRRMTAYGQHQCRALIRELRPYNPVVVSGLAFGVDITAHQAALEFGLPTVACLAQGLNEVYPKAHKNIAQQLLEQGGLVSETWIDSSFHNRFFIRRNRIIAGLSAATIVVESAHKGGSLSTAEMAFSYNREVYAIPGRRSDPQSAGCHGLIERQLAQIYTDLPKLIDNLGWDKQHPQQTRLEFESLIKLDMQEQAVYKLLPTDQAVHIEKLRANWDASAGNLPALLLSLELKGWIRPLPGQLFIRA